MANKVTTEWEDIHVKLGNYEPRLIERPQAEYTKAGIEKLENYDPLEEKNIDELNELEDDFEDEFLKEYMEKRMTEMKVQNIKRKYGSIIEINREEWLKQVNEAEKDVLVVVFLYQDYDEKCQVLNEQLKVACVKYAEAKFVKIIATKAVEDFPDTSLPCIILYKNGKGIQTMSNCYDFGLLETVIKDIIGIETKKVDPELEKYKKALIGDRAKGKEDLSDEDDREYLS